MADQSPERAAVRLAFGNKLEGASLLRYGRTVVGFGIGVFDRGGDP